MLKLYSFQGHKVGSTYAKSMWFTSVLKEKAKNMIISTDTEKPFDTIQHSFMINIPTKVTIGGKYVNI